MIISLLIAISAIVFSSLHNDLIHLPDHSGRASFRTRDEILSLPIMDTRNLPIPFSYAAVLLDIDVYNKEEHALALCSELTRNKQASQLKLFQRLLPCGNDKKKQLEFDIQEETPHMWSTADTLATSSVHFLHLKQLQDLSIVRITAENHNSLRSASFDYTITVSVVGPKNPLYWFNWFNQEVETRFPFIDKQMWNVLALTKQQTVHMLSSFGFIKQYIPNMSKLTKTIRSAVNPQSCRSVDVLPDVSAMRKKCLYFSVNDAVDEVIFQFFPKDAFCRSFFSGGMIVGALVILNIAGFFLFKTNNVSTNIIHFYSFKRLFCSMFAHFDWMHLVFNLRILVISGTKLITLLDCDHLLFLWFYVMSGLGGGMVSLLWRRVRGSCDYSAGASGALYGINMSLVLLARAERDKYTLSRLLSPAPPSSSEALQLLVSVVGMDVLRMVLGGRNVDTAAHVGGALAGLVLASLYLLDASSASSSSAHMFG
jgi:membrane associated rhomboid family serine protease